MEEKKWKQQQINKIDKWKVSFENRYNKALEEAKRKHPNIKKSLYKLK